MRQDVDRSIANVEAILDVVGIGSAAAARDSHDAMVELLVDLLHWCESVEGDFEAALVTARQVHINER